LIFVLAYNRLSIGENQMKMMKVFDCQEMPDGVRTAFFEWAEQGNDCYVAVSVELEEWEDREIIFGWLLANGAVEGETVLVSHWW
jgi:hypothetical protein